MERNIKISSVDNMREARVNIFKSFVYVFAIIGFLLIMVLFRNSFWFESYALEVPTITLSEEDWAKSVSVSISYPESIAEPLYQTIKNGVESEIKEYTEPFIISSEGDTEVRAFYESGFISRTVSNVDITPPTEPEIYLDVNLMSEDKNIMLQVSASDLKSGVSSVNVAIFNYQFQRVEDYFELDMSDITMIGDTFNIEIFDTVGNKRTYSGYYYSVYDYIEDIREYTQKFYSLGDGSQFTNARWAEIVSAFSNLEMAFKSPLIDSSEVNSLKNLIDDLSEGDISFSSRIVEPLIGMDSNILYAVSTENLNALLGSEIVLEVSNPVLSVQEKNDYKELLKTLSGFENIDLYCFKLELSEKTGEEVSLSGSMNIDFLIPEGCTIVKLFDLEEGIFEEVPLAESGERRSGRVYSDGDFFLVVDLDSIEGTRNGYTINGRYYSLELFWGTIGGIIGLLLLAFFIPFLLIQYKDKLSSNKLLSKIRKRNLERRKEKRR
ncbi:MAG: hypothetical protein BWX72_01976 [Firmicutes bacterium ADurb.Bin080]|jgi:hypothetical protein|nr:MAG: hypothetical protein BWX72_01976 [Firmicutes bacterium ADurb.Bin080]